MFNKVVFILRLLFGIIKKIIQILKNTEIHGHYNNKLRVKNSEMYILLLNYGQNNNLQISLSVNNNSAIRIVTIAIIIRQTSVHIVEFVI